MPAPAQIALSALKRLDTLAAAGLAGYCAGSLAQAWLCEDTFCTSGFDTTLYVAVVLLGAGGAALLLWRYASRWWSRALALAAALYAALVVPPVVWSQGRWTVRPAAERSCVVPAQAPVENVHRDCGSPSYGCLGPKFIASESVWNPFAIRVCGFHGDVYGDRLVTYDCGGLVFSVETFGRDPARRPQGCVIQQ
jgi:hypothetical protein